MLIGLIAFSQKSYLVEAMSTYVSLCYLEYLNLEVKLANCILKLREA